MQPLKLTEMQIVVICKEADAERQDNQIWLMHGIRSATYYKQPVDWAVWDAPVIEALTDLSGMNWRNGLSGGKNGDFVFS